VSERLEEICSIELPTGEAVGVHRRRFTGGAGPHVAVVAGVRGDTPEGTRVAHAVGRHLSTHHERLSGTVDVYPCVIPWPRTTARATGPRSTSISTADFRGAPMATPPTAWPAR